MRMALLTVLLMTTLPLLGCAAYKFEGLHVVNKDPCARPEFAAGLVRFLNAKIHQPGGLDEPIVSAPDFVSAGSFRNDRVSLSCHGELITASGRTPPGTVFVSEGELQPDVYWETDADHQRKLDRQKEVAALEESRKEKLAETATLPILNIDQYCSRLYGAAMCITRNQAAYAYLEAVWPELTPKNRSILLSNPSDYTYMEQIASNLLEVQRDIQHAGEISRQAQHPELYHFQP